MQVLTSSLSSLTKSGQSSTPNPSATEVTLKTAYSTPQILMRLGMKLGQPNDSNPSSPLFEVKNFADTKHALRSLLETSNGLIAKAYSDQHFSSGEEISVLQGQLKQMEMRIQQLQCEGAIADSEVTALAPVVDDFYELFSSLEHWLSFQQRYFNIDQQIDSALFATSPSIFSALHGVSPSALTGVNEGIEKMALLIALSSPLLQQQGTFASDLLLQLSGDVTSTCWSCDEWLHDLDMHFSDVITAAEGLWKSALTTQGELERFEKMQEAAELLLSSREVLQNMAKSLPQLKERISDSRRELAKLKESDECREMEKQLNQLEESFNEFATKLPELSKSLDASLNKKKVRTNLAIARKRAEKALAEVDIDGKFKDAVKGYNGETVDSYIVLKRSMRSLLISKVPAAKNIESFFHAEEKRLSADAGYPIDFDELVRIEVAEEGQAKPGFVSRFFSAMDPGNWSKNTVQCWRVGLAALQLSANVLETYQKIQQAPAKIAPSLTAQQQKKLDKETARLGVLLSDKYQVIKDPVMLETLTTKMPEIRSTLKAILEHYTTAPSAAELRQILNSYRTDRQQSLLHGTNVPDAGGRVVKSATQAKKTEAISSGPIKNAGVLLPAAAQKAEAVQSLQEASISLENSHRQLHECRAIDYLFPTLNTSPKSLQRLKEEVTHLQKCLKQTMNSLSQTESLAPNQEVIEVCQVVKEMEKRIAKAMLAYQESMAISLKPPETLLDPFGNKHKNIVKQADLVDALGLEGVVVPRPRGISSEQVTQFLTTAAPKIFDHWDALGDLHASYNGEGPFLDSADAAAHLKAIQEGIDSAFAKASSDDSAFSALGLSKEIQEWLHEMKSRGNFLMVRSTGAEDSRKHANAGGNDSIAYVVPTTGALCDALGKVVRSYFGYNSLKSRLDANLNPFKEPLKMAVTTQELIGETIGGASDPSQIPISLVLFSNEPLYVGNEEFRAMRISAAYGHGEGVVGNKGISGDSALILQSRSHPDQLYVLYDNQHKPSRLAPVKDKESRKIVLEKLPNSQEMANHPVLNGDLLRRLYEWGVIGEKFFDNFPTDMEIVIKGGTIYPVQARPVNRPISLPTYLDLKKIDLAAASPIEKTLLTEMLVPGMASVVQITRQEEILMAETLEKAESLFRKGQHKLVVVAKPEPALSHPVINFSNMGMPCLYAEEFSAVQDFVKNIDEQHQLAICVQSAAIHLWDRQKGSIDEFQSRGFVVHPAKVAISLPIELIAPERVGISGEMPKEVRELLSQLRTATTSQAGLGHLKALRENTWIKAFKIQLQDLESKASRDWKLQKLAAPTITAAHALDKALNRAFSEVEATLEDSTFNGRLELLLHVKALDTLLFQKPSSENALMQHSVLGFTGSFAAADALIDYQKQLPHPAHFADVLLDGSECPIDDVFDDWKNFLIKLEPIAHRTLNREASNLSIAEIARFKAVLQTLRQGGVLPIFTTFFFGPLVSKEPVDLLRAINSLLPDSEEPLIERLALQKQSMRQLKDDLGKFAEPKAFAEVLERLQKMTAQFHPDNQPWLQKAQWSTASPITRSIALQTMNDLVELYDSAIKSMKASRQFKDEIEQTQKFKQMLGPYFALLRGWAEKTVGEGGFATHSSWPLSQYLNQIESIFKGLPDGDPMQLKSSQFSVSAAVLGAGTAFERHLPAHLEDIFTLIHQNLMASTSALTKELFSAEQIAASPLPDNLKLALARAPSIGGEAIGGEAIGHPQLIGIDIDSKGLVFRYNVPLRNHSGKFSIRYERQKIQLSMETLFLGVARARWDQGSERATLLNAVGILHLLSNPKVTPNDLTYSCDITQEKNLEATLQEYRDIALLSLNRGNPPLQRSFIQKLVNAGSLTQAVQFVIREKMRSEFALSLFSSYLDEIDSGNDFTEVAIPFILEMSKDLNAGTRRRALAFIGNIIYRGHGVNEAITIATDLFRDPISQVQETALALFGKIIEHGQGLDEVIAIATKQSKDNDWQVRSNALLLMEILVERGHGISEAITAATKISRDGGYIGQKNALKLFEIIIERGHGINEAIAAAMELSKSVDADVRIFTLALLEKIVKTGQGASEIISAMVQLSKENHSILQGFALQFFAKIVEHGQGIDEAITVAVKLSKAWDPIVRGYSVKLLEKIIDHDQGHGITEVVTTAAELSRDPVAQVRTSALGLFEKVVEQGHGINEAITAAANLISDPFVKEFALTLFEKIMDHGQGQGINEAIIAAVELTEKPGHSKIFALTVFEKIVERGHGIDEAIIAAVKLKNIAYTRDFILSLFGKIVQHGQGHGINEAITTAVEQSKADDEWVRNSALQLFKKIVEHGYGFREAIQVAAGELRKPDEEDSGTISPDLRKNLLLLLLTTIERLDDFSEIIPVIAELSEKTDSHSQRAALKLLTKIIERGYGYSEGIAAAARLSKISHPVVSEAILELFEAVINNVNQSQNISEAIAAARKLSHELPSELNDHYFRLWEALITTPEGAKSAKQLVEEEWSYWQYFDSNHKTYLAVLTKLQLMLKEKNQ